MKSNHIILIGYVAKDLFVTESKNGCRRVAIRMSTHYPRKNELGEKIWQTVWHDVVAWGNTAEYAERNFVKGSKIMVDGSVQYRTYADYTGHTRYVTQIRAHSMMNLDR
jgi:single-strand DNA-binding protein